MKIPGNMPVANLDYAGDVWVRFRAATYRDFPHITGALAASSASTPKPLGFLGPCVMTTCLSFAIYTAIMTFTITST